MKNVDFKKLFILIAIIVAIVAVVFLITKLGNNETKLTEEESKVVENVSLNYILNLTEGYSSTYAGLDILFQRDEVKVDTLEVVEILNTAIKYARDNGFREDVEQSKIQALADSKKYGDVYEYSIYNAGDIRKAIKELFGIKDYNDRSVTENYNFIYDYYYDFDNDVYLVKRNDVKSNSVDEKGIDYKVISSVGTKDNKAKVTLAIGYTTYNDKKYTYSADPAGETIIAEDVKEFPEDKIDEFQKYEITLKKVDKKYVFESMKKVK